MEIKITVQIMNLLFFLILGAISEANSKPTDKKINRRTNEHLLSYNKPITYKNIGYKTIDITDRLPDFLEKHSDIPILLLILLGKKNGASAEDYTSVLKYKYGGGKVKNEEVFDANGRLRYLNKFLYNDYRSSVRDAQNYLKPNSYTGNPSDYIVKTSARKDSDTNNDAPYIDQIKKIIKEQGKHSRELQLEKRDVISESTEKIIDKIDEIIASSPNPPLVKSQISNGESLSQQNNQLVNKIESLLN